jgi:glucose/arabinose dehydrogenase
MQRIVPVILAMLACGFVVCCLATDGVGEGRELYMAYCASCHGAKLQGGNAQSLVDGVWQFGADRNYIIRNTKYGIPHLGMPSYEDSLTDRQIHRVVDFLLASERQAGVKPPAPPKTLETLDYHIHVAVWVEGLEVPWSIDWLDEDRALVTERPGRLRLIRDGQMHPDPIGGTPAVLNEGQGGLLEVAVDPEYEDNGWVYLAYSQALDREQGRDRPGAMTRIVRGRLKDHRWTDQQVVYEAPRDSYRTTRHHYGCRIVFDPQGYLYFGIGDRGTDEHAQDLTRPNGKIHRIHPDGRIPKDNPFVPFDGALDSIYCYGIRNPQGLAVHPQTGRVWETEHGPMGGDELNLIAPGLNYGWPVVTYGLNYNGTVISRFRKKPGMTVPNLYWRPSPALCGLDFYQGDLFPEWNNHLLVGALKYEQVELLDVEDDRVVHQETLLKNAGRVRDVACGPDSAIYVVLNRPGMILRLTPSREKLP